MIRKIVHIDEEKCDGCGLCASACHEGAIRMINGKAKLVSESYCDGLGDCLGECPQGAITIEEREARPFDQAAVAEHLAALDADRPAQSSAPTPGASVPTRLGHWPVQLSLVPPNAPFLAGADLLVCADCVPLAVGDFHDRYLAGRVVMVGCPKFDDVDYYLEKLKTIFAGADARSITVLRMEVPCCGGIERTAVSARNSAAPNVDIDIVTIGVRGEELERRHVRGGTGA